LGFGSVLPTCPAETGPQIVTAASTPWRPCLLCSSDAPKERAHAPPDSGQLTRTRPNVLVQARTRRTPRVSSTGEPDVKPPGKSCLSQPHQAFSASPRPPQVTTTNQRCVLRVKIDKLSRRIQRASYSTNTRPKANTWSSQRVQTSDPSVSSFAAPILQQPKSSHDRQAFCALPLRVSTNDLLPRKALGDESPTVASAGRSHRTEARCSRHEIRWGCTCPTPRTEVPEIASDSTW